jgi:molybdenum cofactor synthesis domain-containing protein
MSIAAGAHRIGDMLKARVITCSDASSRGERVDKSGPAVRAVLVAGGYDVDSIVIVADNVDEIAAAIEAATNDGMRLIVTTGGTGIAARDVTPEATWRVCEKVIPGFGEVMRTRSMEKTAMAPLSRAQAATRGKALIVNLPGSESGARENLQAVLHLIPHALQLLEGKTEHS